MNSGDYRVHCPGWRIEGDRVGLDETRAARVARKYDGLSRVPRIGDGRLTPRKQLRGRMRKAGMIYTDRIRSYLAECA